MRCSHCAVGYTLQTKDPDALPMDIIYRRLDEIPQLEQYQSRAENQCSQRNQLKISLNPY